MPDFAEIELYLVILCAGNLAVFGGYNARYLATAEVLNGSKWQTEPLQVARSDHAMVILPCP